MTTPATGPISLLDIQNEFGGTAPISLNEYYRGGSSVPLVSADNTTGLLNIPTSGQIGVAAFRGVYKNSMGNYFASNSHTWTLPTNTPGKINIICIGGGGGGGGGSNRSYAAGFLTGGAGGGSGGNAYAFNVTAAPGSSLVFTIGAGGSGGGTRDGVYPNNATVGTGSAGGTTSVSLNGVVLCRATGGQPGTRSQAASTTTGNPGGAAGVSQIPNAFTIKAPTAGIEAVKNTQVGGAGAKGYLINDTVPSTPGSVGDVGLYIMSYGSMGLTYATNTNAVSGTGIGAGGSGGGTVQGDVGGQPLNRRNSTNGLSGGVFVFWNY